MVSWRLCQKLVEYKVNKSRKIIVFGEEPQPAYDRVNLTKYFELESSEDLYLSKSDWYAANDIELHTSSCIVKVDTVQRLVVNAEGEEIVFGECVFATGSSAFVPPILGADSKNVFVYRTIADIEAIKAAAQGAHRGLVIGGGLLGLEAANVLKDLKVDTVIVEAANALMSRQLGEDASSYLIREVAALGMSVRLKTITESIRPQGDGLLVTLKGDDELDVDLVIVAAGIRPRDELAREAGLGTGARGGILVDDNLETQVSGVYAIGECVCHRGELYGLIAPGYEMADILATGLAGKPVRYEGSDTSSRLKLLGVDVGSFGDPLQEGTTIVHRGEKTYRSLLFRRSELIGATVVGEWDQAAEVERAIKERRSFGQGQREEFERTGDLFDPAGVNSVIFWPANAIVCNCTRTSCGALKELVAGGCRSVDELTNATGAGGICGSCAPQLAQLVGEDADAIADVAQPKGKLLLWVSAVIAVIACLVYIIAPPFPAAESVQSSYYEFTKIWQDSLTKQITGYTILGLSVIALLLSARKRIRWLSFGNYGFWRAAHSWLGVLTL
ncbi:MAG: FAD-dependent oxidoreductase, partial [Verrucomicrobiota bacterium]